MAEIMTSVDLGEGVQAIEVDTDPTVELASGIQVGSLVFYAGIWYRRVAGGVVPELGPHGYLHMASGLDALPSGAIGSGMLGQGSILSASIASGQIGPEHLASGVIQPASLTSGSVRSGHIGDGAVVSGSIASGSIGIEHLASGIQAGTSYASPISWTMVTKVPDVIGQGTWVILAAAGVLHGGYFYNTSNANGDNYSINVRVPAGTYKLTFNYIQYTDVGIVDVDLDGVEIGSQDMYGGASQVTIKQITGIVMNGPHVLKFRIHGKNGSASAYYFKHHGMMLERTGD